MINLNTTYLGLELNSPLVASASPLSEKVTSARQLEDAGIAAIVMYSLFEEQIIQESLELDYYLSRGTHSFAEATSYLPEPDEFKLRPDAYVEQVRKLKEALDIPIIGSLNGVSTGGWIQYAQLIEEAGADALELNVYYLPTDPELAGSELEYTYINLVRDVRAKVDIPVAVKISPFFTSLPNAAKRLVEVGADGLVLFNRFYQPDFDLDNMEVTPNLELSSSSDLRLPLRWASILFGQVEADLALSSGIHTGEDLVKATLAGASVSMTASALLRQGVGCISEILGGLKGWMESHDYESVAQMKGSMSQQSVAEPAAFERANYIKVLGSFSPSNQSLLDR